MESPEQARVDLPIFDPDGVRTLILGTALWAVTAIGLLPFWGALREHGLHWWFWTAVAGIGLGLIGIEFTLRRARRRIEVPEAFEDEPTIEILMPHLQERRKAEPEAEHAEEVSRTARHSRHERTAKKERSPRREKIKKSDPAVRPPGGRRKR